MKTVFNPAEALRFADWLEEETARMMFELHEANLRLLELRSAWNDSKYDDYTRQFDSSTEALARFSEESELYVSYLRKKSAIVSEYLNY